MESISSLLSIKSKVNIRLVFSFLNKERKYKLVVRSKSFQDILNLSLESYKEKFLESIKTIDFLNCLTTKNESGISSKNSYKNILKINWNNELNYCKIHKNKINEMMSKLTVDCFTNLYNEYKSKEEIDKNILDDQLIIDIYSPFYEVLLGEEILEKLFMLRIPFPIIYDKKLMDDYYNATDRLSELNPNFSSFYFEMNYGKDNKYLYDFKDFCAYFKIIKKLVVEFKSHDNSLNFPVKIFSYSSIKNNLIYLELKAIGQFLLSNAKNFEQKLEDLNALEELRLDGVESFHLGKRNLKYIYFANCDNITFDQDCFSNMRIINLFRVKLFNPKTFSNNKIDIPELIQFKVSFYYRELSSIFNFKSCHKLKHFIRLISSDFLNLGETSLEKVYIRKIISREEEINILKKLIEIKTIKEIKIDIMYITEENLKEIEGENTSVEILIIDWNYYNDYKDNYFFDFDLENKNIKLDGFQQKFPNLKEFLIYINGYNYSGTGKLEIEQNSKCKINKFKFSGGYNNNNTISFYTSPFENLVDIEFGCLSPYFNYKESFPLFNEKCETVFKSLKIFKFNCPIYSRGPVSEIDYVKNLINNLDKMPNLENFIFIAYCNIDKITYDKLVEKLLLSNIKNIEFNILNSLKGEYSKEELANIYKDIDIKKFGRIKIVKL